MIVYWRVVGSSLLVVSLVLGCKLNGTVSGDKEGKSNSPSHPAVAGGGGPNRLPAIPSFDLRKLEGQPLDKRIVNASRIADAVLNALKTCRANLFSEGFEQANVLLCSAHRLERLSHRKLADFHTREARDFLFLLRKAVAGQRFLRVAETRENYGSYYEVTAFFVIPTAKPYQVATWNIVVYSLDNWNAVTNVRFYLEPQQNCSDVFLEAIPNSKNARDLEARSVATIFARALRRLDSCPNRLKSIEEGASKANSLRLILQQLKRDLELDATDPAVAGAKMRDHEQELRGAVGLLREAVPSIEEKYSVPRAEVDAILNIFEHHR